MIERRKTISEDEFITRYRAQHRPVIISGLVPGVWPALDKWNLPYLKETCGDQTIQVLANRSQHDDYEMNFDRHRQNMSFGDYIEWVSANPVSNDIYIHAQNNFMATDGGKRLLPDIPPLPYFNPSEHGYNFWFGPGGTVTPLHCDMCEIMFMQIVGRKQWTLYTEEQRHLLYIREYHSEVDVENPVQYRERFPLFRFASHAKFVLNPGEALYLPGQCYHHVRSLDISVSVSCTNFKAMQ